MMSAVNRKNYSIFVVALTMIVILSLIVTPLINATYMTRMVYAQESDNGETSTSSAEDSETSSNETQQTSPAPTPDDEATSPTPQIPPEPPLRGNDTIDAADTNRTGGSQFPSQPQTPIPDMDYFCRFFYPDFPIVCPRGWIDESPRPIPPDDVTASEVIRELVLATQNTNMSISPKDTQLVSLADHVLGFVPTIEAITNTSEVVEDGRIGLTYRLNETSNESEIFVLSTRTNGEDNRYIIFEDLDGTEVSEIIWVPRECDSQFPQPPVSDPIKALICEIMAPPHTSADGQTAGLNVTEPTIPNDIFNTAAIEIITDYVVCKGATENQTSLQGRENSLDNIEESMQVLRNPDNCDRTLAMEVGPLHGMYVQYLTELDNGTNGDWLTSSRILVERLADQGAINPDEVETIERIHRIVDSNQSVFSKEEQIKSIYDEVIRDDSSSFTTIAIASTALNGIQLILPNGILSDVEPGAQSGPVRDDLKGVESVASTGGLVCATLAWATPLLAACAAGWIVGSGAAGTYAGSQN